MHISSKVSKISLYEGLIFMFIILIKLNIFSTFSFTCRHTVFFIRIRIETFIFSFYLVLTCLSVFLCHVLGTRAGARDHQRDNSGIGLHRALAGLSAPHIIVTPTWKPKHVHTEGEVRCEHILIRHLIISMKVKNGISFGLLSVLF